MHVQKMADINNENMWNPRYVAYIRCFFQSLLLFVLCIVRDCNGKMLSTEKQIMLKMHIFYKFIMVLMYLMIQFLIIQIFEEWSKGAFVIKPGDEDIHTANERRLKVSNCLDGISRHQQLAL